MTDKGLKRLKKLLSHVQAGRPGGHKKFYFGFFHKGREGKKYCGRKGCPAGELPVVFPKKWGFKGPLPYLLTENLAYPDKQLARFFGATEKEILHLFTPCWQDTDLFGGKILKDNCSVKDWIDNCCKFITYVEKDRKRWN